MNEVAAVSGGMVPYRSPSVEKTSQDLKRMAVTEACASGLCDICLYQTGLCTILGQHRGNSYPFRRSGEEVNKSVPIL